MADQVKMYVKQALAKSVCLALLLTNCPNAAQQNELGDYDVQHSPTAAHVEQNLHGEQFSWG